MVSSYNWLSAGTIMLLIGVACSKPVWVADCSLTYSQVRHCSSALQWRKHHWVLENLILSSLFLAETNPWACLIKLHNDFITISTHFFKTPIPHSYTSLLLYTVSRNCYYYFVIYMDTQNHAIHCAWIHLFSYLLCPRRKTIWTWEGSC